MIHITEDEVVARLPMNAAIECLRSAFDAYGRGQAVNQPRRRLVLPTGAVLHQMAASCGDYFGTKVYSTHARHGAWFTFHLFDSRTARPVAQFEANHLGQIRTGAASGLATDLLAPRRPLTVAVIGSGFQARSQVEAIRDVREIGEMRIYSRSEEKRERFAWEVRGVASGSAADACEDADVIVTATSSKEPVFPASVVKSGALILAMGANTASRSEVPPEVVLNSEVIVDDVQQCQLEAGDLLKAGVDWSSVIPLADLVRGKTKAGDGRLLLFKSVGLALEDVAVASHVYEQTILARSSAGRNHAMR